MSSIEIAPLAMPLLENLCQRGAGFHGAGDEFGVLVLDRPQLVFDLLAQGRVRPLELRLCAGLRVLADANPAGPTSCSVALRLSFCRSRSASGPLIKMPSHRNFIDRRCHHAARGLDVDLEAAGQPFVLAPLRAFAPAQQHRAARFQLLRKHGDGLAGLGDAFAVGFGFLGGAVDFDGAVADRSDEAGSGRGILPTSRWWSCSARPPRR